MTSFCRVCRSGEVYVDGGRIRIKFRLHPAPFHRVSFPCVQAVAPRAALQVQTIRSKFTRVQFPDPKELASEGRGSKNRFPLCLARSPARTRDFDSFKRKDKNISKSSTSNPHMHKLSRTGSSRLHMLFEPVERRVEVMPTYTL